MGSISYDSTDLLANGTKLFYDDEVYSLEEADATFISKDGHVQIPISLDNGWINYGAPFSPASYTIINGFCYVQGLIRNGTLGVYMAADLPLPVQREIHIGECSNNVIPARVDVVEDGRIYIIGPVNAWISLQFSYRIA